MSKYDKASLVHIPSGYKSGTLYNVLPNDADGDFDFTRASTATRVDENGLIETIATGTPRLNYPLLDGVVQDNPTLLLEPQRTNLMTYSEDFSQWDTTQNSTLTSDSTTSPNGSLNATKITDNSTNGNHRIFTSLTTTSGSHTFSVFLKKGTMTTAHLRFLSGSDIATANVNLEEGTITATTGTAKIDNYGNDWYRCSITGTAVSGTSYVYVYMKQLAGYSGSSQDLFLWGAQVEAGSYPTSYIPTSGSSVTRSADVANGAGTADDFNDSEGVVYLNIKPIALDSTHKRITLSDGTSTNRIIMGIANNNQVLATVYDGANQAILGGSYSNMDDLQKVALKYKTNDFSLHYNGFKVATDTSGNTFAAGTLNQFRFEDGNGSLDFYGIVKEAITFNEALSDIELETLTSYDSFNSMATEQLYTIK